ncbi:hypothetical protein RJE46_08570 [Cedecea neteri]|uniref:hypothetical protein n=1 Tax=Cedecea neteri TaxID=158822 RepID=UPI002892C6C9|nr:hypothetical protein [Cedecea neteri]WNJ81265.1 hypothetical protein RJE46_08570 [Cedecea neteri]
MLKNSFIRISKLILGCLVLFLIADAVSVLLASLIVYAKKDYFLFNWRDVFSSFFEFGYIGGLILGVGLWIRSYLQERKDKRFN